MNFLETIVYKGLEAFGRYYGTYRAIVVEGADEQNRIVLICSSISPSPILAYPKGQEGSLDSGYKWFSPLPGQVVYVEFIQGELSYPVWSYHGWGKDEIPDELKSKSIAGIKSKRGHLITLDEEAGVLKIVITSPSEEEAVATTIIIGEEVSLDTKRPIKLIGESAMDIDITEAINMRQKELIFNKGTVGIPKSDSLVTKINKLETDLNNLRTALSPSSAVLTGMVPTWLSVQNWALPVNNIPLTKVSDIANTKIKQ